MKVIRAFLTDIATINQAQVNNVHWNFRIKYLGQYHPASLFNSFLGGGLFRNKRLYLNEILTNSICIYTFNAIHIALNHYRVATTQLLGNDGFEIGRASCREGVQR